MNNIASETPNDAFAMPRSVAIVGLGLLGGSVALSLRRVDPSIKLIGCARRRETRQWIVDHAVVDVATDDPIDAAAQAELVVVATPVDVIAETVISISKAVPGVWLTDVGSTKAGIVELVSECNEAAGRFVAAHPIAGSEKTGVENATATLFEARPVVLTPSGLETPSAIDRVELFWKTIGGRISRMPALRHDQLLAISSHMPHLMASLIAGQLPIEAQPIVGTGWLDTTRIAAGDPKLWTAIVAENREAIASSLRSTRDELDEVIGRIENKEDGAIENWLRNAQSIRKIVEANSAG